MNRFQTKTHFYTSIIYLSVITFGVTEKENEDKERQAFERDEGKHLKRKKK